ncbi:hypothetical protein [Halorubrum ezzemoulense]|uniref:hypothetical protein n=1 Tax=Halorubrum ezzemoulense TaxID=337243 RepID=UPI00232BB626|nr:hypothetical protein [Halorubrum ezzemoulense]
MNRRELLMLVAGGSSTSILSVSSVSADSLKTGTITTDESSSETVEITIEVQ